MPQVDEFFGSTTISLNEIERDLEAGVSAGVELAFGVIPTGATLPNGQPDCLIQKRTRLAPSTAVSIGKALQEAGERLSGPDLEVVKDMAVAAQEVQAQAALRNGNGQPAQD